jgi:H+/Cl- antiporter ClcA
VSTGRGDGATQATPSAAELLRSRGYLGLVAVGAIIGVPVATIAYFFLKVVNETQRYVFSTLPDDLGAGIWWPMLPLTLCGLLVALTIRHLPGTGGHRPAEGFKAGAPVSPIELPGIFIASFLTLGLGVVLGPEAPLIAIGSGIGVLALHLLRRDAPAQAAVVIGGAGSFAAVSTLLGSPLVAAFLMLEVAAIGGAMLGVLLVPGLLASGIGALVFVGLDSWTGFGTFALAIPDIPPFTSPDGVQFLWAIGIGVAAAALAALIKLASRVLQAVVERRMTVAMPFVGLGIGAVAVGFALGSDRDATEVLYSGQDQLPALITGAAGWSLGALVLLLVCKSLAYALSLSCFRGGPVFPAMLIGAAGGIALSELPGLPLIAGVAMGIGAMTVAMLNLPLTSVLLVAVFLQADGVALMPLVIVAVVVSYIASARVAPVVDRVLARAIPARPAPA